jgi:hypothetical protein
VAVAFNQVGHRGLRKLDCHARVYLQPFASVVLAETSHSKAKQRSSTSVYLDVGVVPPA